MPRKRRLRYRLNPGDRVSICRGHEEPPAWLGGKDHVLGTVLRTDLQHPGLAVVELDDELTVRIDWDDGQRRAQGRYLILSPRFTQRWWSPGWSRVVHLELHESLPSEQDSSRLGESHAQYRVLTE